MTKSTPTKSRLSPRSAKSVGSKPAAKGHSARHTAAKAPKAAPARTPAATTPKRGTREAQVVALLRRPDGLSVDELVDACGVQSHTARAMISVIGRKAGGVERDGKRYRLR